MTSPASGGVITLWAVQTPPVFIAFFASLWLYVSNGPSSTSKVDEQNGNKVKVREPKAPHLREAFGWLAAAGALL